MDIYLAGGYTGNLKAEWRRLIDSDFVCGDIKIYLTGNHREKLKAIAQNKYNGMYILESFYYADKHLERLIPHIGSFMLDSGAFTFFTSGKHVEWDEYVERYCDFVNRNGIGLFFELDIDSLVGYDEVKRLRGRIERLTGKQPIPVWHKSRGMDEFYRICDEYPYVSIGGIASREIKPKEYKAFPHMIKEAHRRGAKIHGLGFTNLEGLKRYHFDSVDSTAWLSGNRFGSVYRFNGETLEKIKRDENQRINDSNMVAQSNFREWVKFQRYADTHL